MFQPVVYFQTDPRWKDVPYAVKGEESTIGTAGCGPSCMAMILATWCDKSVTPQTEAAWSLSHKHKYINKGTAYSYFKASARRYGLHCYQLNYHSVYHDEFSLIHDSARCALDNGCLVIACMGPGFWTNYGHFVLVYKIENDRVFLNDPASSDIRKTHADYREFKYEVKYYFIIDPPTT